jgi:phenylalanyl-tRNA synthetase beta chain
MKFSEQWLRQWVNPSISSKELLEQLTLAGLEVATARPVSASFTDVIIGNVLSVTPHPNADRLRVCQVEIGDHVPLSIVCGAANVREGLNVAVAKIGAVLPNLVIKKSKLRGVESSGMLCSESELGLTETSTGIMELAVDAPIGENIRTYLKLDDFIIDIELTPNRGDCLSILGIGREVAAINKLNLIEEVEEEPLTTSSFSDDEIAVNIVSSKDCLHYVGRVIRGVNNQVNTPPWMKERLRRSDVGLISPIVDITNYVMLELGQPLHAFDLNFVRKGIEVRLAHPDEKIQLLDQRQLTLDPTDLLVISDNKPVALAGIMGEQGSGVSLETTDIFLESALFNSARISKTARRLGIFTESSHRFERGVDVKLQKRAIQRCTQLILEIANGLPGPLIERGEIIHEKNSILLRRHRIEQILGIKFNDEEIVDILERLNMEVIQSGVNWQVTPPSYRQDLQTEVSLIGELARLKGYNQIPSVPLQAELKFLPIPEKKLTLANIKKLFTDRGYQEAITYSFVDPSYEKLLALQPKPLSLLNPISVDLSVMRTNHWPGLLKTYQYNAYRQQSRVRLIEIGLCFDNTQAELLQGWRLGGLCAGPLMPEQWGEARRSVDFHDIRNDIESLLKLAKKSNYDFQKVEHPALHPGKSAKIICDQVVIGLIGALHPSLAQKLDIQQPLYLFDLKLDSIMNTSLPSYTPISKFPAIRRDLALIMAKDVEAGSIKKYILNWQGELLRDVQIFDVYQGKGIDVDKKSIAFSLVFQHVSRTLVDAEINDFMQKIVAGLYNEFNATLRD